MTGAGGRRAARLWGRASAWRVVALLVTVAAAQPCLAERVRIPVSLPAGALESLVRDLVFADDGRLRVADDGTGCQYLELRRPKVHLGGGRVLLRTLAEVRAGRAIGSRCLLAVSWSGELEFAQRPEVAAGGDGIVLQTESWRALQPDGSTATLSTAIGRGLEQFLPAGIRRIDLDLAQPIDQLRDVLRLMVAPSATAGVQPDSLAVDAAEVSDQAATVTLGVDAVMPAAPPPRRPEAVLSDAELAAVERRLDAVDGFFTYTVKSLGEGPGDAAPASLLEVLVELRRELVGVLAEPRQRGPDPARRLFVHAWQGLTPVLKSVAERQPDSAGTWRYLTFIGAGNALKALDELGPAAGIEISSDGLRRLARMLAPGAAGDPLEHGDAVDAELRRVLGFGPPLPPPSDYDDTSQLDRWLGWLVPTAAAAVGVDAGVVKKLNNWVPKPRDMDVYLPMVRDVLGHVVGEQLGATELAAPFHDVFRRLVLTAAWQESCWRQFVAKNDKRVPMESSSGDLGIMQVNPRVWRGLYDLQGLRWDIAYNARAGADVLEHYMVDYAVSHREQQAAGGVDNLARSAYAAYNGGPRQYDRYRRAGASARGRKVDALFYEQVPEDQSGQRAGGERLLRWVIRDGRASRQRPSQTGIRRSARCARETPARRPAFRHGRPCPASAPSAPAPGLPPVAAARPDPRSARESSP